ncbi:Bro-N domain-containing protein [Streptomyces sp. NPDC003300]|uniref:BRO-N domain-containing protein n=1 Tax=unclassified Streptomyces TaxID=2593676 RepID=UPI0033B50DBD
MSIERFTTDEFDIELRPDGDAFKVVAAGVARALGFHSAKDMLRTVPDAEKGWETAPTPGGEQQVWHLTEPGFYRVIGQRQANRVKDLGVREQVERFQSWVYGVVLPGLRKEANPGTPPLELPPPSGVLPYRDQAELLVLLRPVLPEPYAVATGKVIMARAMGEVPALESSETPLYAAVFLAEQGHKAKTVAKFQSGFGARVSNRYFKVHGRRPGKVPGPAGSRIDKVVAYTEDDRPLLTQVYAEMADVINMFETGGQQAIGA